MASPVQEPSQAASHGLINPIPMSFPAILRNGLNPTFQDQHTDESSIIRERARRTKYTLRREGKQWVRRRENTQFTSNPHIAAPTARDMVIPLPGHKPAFPQPLPSYLKRSTDAPHWRPPVSQTSGRPSLRGLRKVFRGAGPHAEFLVKAFEVEILGWLHNPVLNPDVGQAHQGRLIAGGRAREISKTHAELVWFLPEDGFARYVLHSLARFHCLVSFSKETPNGERFTHVLRPRAPLMARPRGAAVTSLDTPPITELDSASDFIGSPDFRSEASDAELDAVAEESEGDWVHVPDGNHPGPGSDSWSGGRIDDAESDSMIASLTLEDDATPRRPLERPATVFSRPHLRSGSSPSPSPGRTRRSRTSSAFMTVRAQTLQMLPASSTKILPSNVPTFYDYVWGGSTLKN